MQKRSNYPSIDPIPAGTPRPFWSVMIPTYNCADLLKRTLASVLDQDPGPDDMQIEVIDDRSTKDDPEAVVAALGKGRVKFFRQPQNVGAQANFTTCIARATGQWVHILHGDDMVRPGYYSRIRQAAESVPSLGAAFCRYIFIDEDDHWQRFSEIERRTAGILSDYLEAITRTNPIMFPAISVKREVYERIGGFHSHLFHAADWDMWKRVYLNTQVWYEPEPLALYRVHSASDSSTLMKTGANIADGRASIAISEAYLPRDRAAKLSYDARQFLALAALGTARQLLREGHPQAALAQIREALKTQTSLTTATDLARLAVSTTLWSAKSRLRALQGRLRTGRAGGPAT
jgi:glycosyltransferase involved in cell wall biosynthesis